MRLARQNESNCKRKACRNFENMSGSKMPIKVEQAIPREHTCSDSRPYSPQSVGQTSKSQERTDNLSPETLGGVYTDSLGSVHELPLKQTEIPSATFKRKSGPHQKGRYAFNEPEIDFNFSPKFLLTGDPLKIRAKPRKS